MKQERKRKGRKGKKKGKMEERRKTERITEFNCMEKVIT